MLNNHFIVLETTMLLCVLCFSDIPSDYQYYQCNDMGPEIISTIENAFGHDVSKNDLFNIPKLYKVSFKSC